MNLISENIPTQERVHSILNNFLQYESIPHAFLFSGPDGVGKENTAIQFAKNLAAIRSKADEIDRIITAIEQLQEPYIKYIFPLPRGRNETDTSTPTEKLTSDEIDLIREQLKIKSKNPFHKIVIPKANSIKINSIRDIKKFLSLNYDETGFRFIIISDAHLMNDEAQNALLKSLEEPPDNVVFILSTSMISKLRPTIISRCWKISFDPLPAEVIVEILTKKFQIEKSVSEEVAQFAMGSVQSALKLIESDFQNLKEKTISILRYSFGRKFHSAFEELNSVLSTKSSTEIHIVIFMILIWLNDIQKNRLGLDNLFYNDYLETIEKFNSKFPDIDVNILTSKLEKLSNLTRNNINPNLLSANLIIELSSVVLEST